MLKKLIDIFLYLLYFCIGTLSLMGLGITLLKELSVLSVIKEWKANTVISYNRTNSNYVDELRHWLEYHEDNLLISGAITPRTGNSFKECFNCPEMVNIPAGIVNVDIDLGDYYMESNKKLTLQLKLAAFAMSKYEITVAQFRDFIQTTYRYQTCAEKIDGCYSLVGTEWKTQSDRTWRNPGFKQTDESPVVCVNLDDALFYARWLSEKTGKTYRLPAGIEWEYAAHTGSQTIYFRNNPGQANNTWYRETWDQLHSTGENKPNSFGLYNMQGGALEWIYSYATPYAGFPGESSIKGNNPALGDNLQFDHLNRCRSIATIGFRLIRQFD